MSAPSGASSLSLNSAAAKSMRAGGQHSLGRRLGAPQPGLPVPRLPGGALKLQCGGAESPAEVFHPRAWRGRRHGTLESEGRRQISAPMPGKVVRVLVQTGDRVEAGQGLMVVEAMKMQNEIKSPKSGVVERILVAEGQAVNSGEVLAWIE